MRQRKAILGARVNGDLALRFTADGLTSYSGLELFRRFLHQIDLSCRLRRHLRRCDPGGDFSSVAIVHLVIAMLTVGARRLRHLQYLVGDPVVLRFAGLAVLPSPRTLSRWLGRCKASVRDGLQSLTARSSATASGR